MCTSAVDAVPQLSLTHTHTLLSCHSAARMESDMSSQRHSIILFRVGATSFKRPPVLERTCLLNDRAASVIVTRSRQSQTQCREADGAGSASGSRVSVAETWQRSEASLWRDHLCARCRGPSKAWPQDWYRSMNHQSVSASVLVSHTLVTCSNSWRLE